MPIYKGSSKANDVYKSGIKTGRVYRGSKLVFQSYKEQTIVDYTITYHTDRDVSYTETVSSGKSVLSPTTFTPSKSGWTFVGWMEDSTASGDVLTTKSANKNMDLYAVYSHTVTVSYDGNGSTSGSTSSESKTRYWNVADVFSNPVFVLKSNGFLKSGYSFSKWAKGSTSGTQYDVGKNLELTEDTTFYAIWSFTSVTYSKPTLTLVSSSLSGSNATSNSCNTSSNGIVFSMNAGYGQYTANAKTSASYNLSGATKVVVNFTCTEGSNSGNYDYMNFTFKVGSYSATANSIDKTSGSATITISGLTSAQLEITALWILNSNYVTSRGGSIYITSVVIS